MRYTEIYITLECIIEIYTIFKHTDFTKGSWWYPNKVIVTLSEFKSFSIFISKFTFVQVKKGTTKLENYWNSTKSDILSRRIVYLVSLSLSHLLSVSFSLSMSPLYFSLSLSREVHRGSCPRKEIKNLCISNS